MAASRAARKVALVATGMEANVKATFAVQEDSICINGKPLFGGTERELLDEMEQLVGSGSAAMLVTLNVDQTLNMETDRPFRQTVQNAELVVIDGTPISWLGKLLGARSVARNTGADLLPAAVREAKDRGWKIAITGGADDTVRGAAKNLHRGGADVVAIPFPMICSLEDESAETVVEALSEYGPSLVFLCLGSPKQELWFQTWRDKLPPALYIGAGAAVDFAAQTVDRAPRWMQRAGLEWLFRLLREPRRLTGRYLIKGPRFLRVIIRSLRNREQWGQHG